MMRAITSVEPPTPSGTTRVTARRTVCAMRLSRFAPRPAPLRSTFLYRFPS
jgi:hypothetical protein